MDNSIIFLIFCVTYFNLVYVSVCFHVNINPYCIFNSQCAFGAFWCTTTSIKIKYFENRNE